MSTTIEGPVPERLGDADLTPRGRVQPSPADWRDQVFYFLLPDRFSDGGECNRALFDRSVSGAHAAADKAAWMAAGKDFQGGTLKGVRSKLDYLEGLGVTALWIGPVWRQRPDLDTYHGYGIQDFLDVDPRFGTRQDLRDLVDAAHDRGMYAILDVIYNHSGNNWFYDLGGRAETTAPYRHAPPREVHGWRSASGEPTTEIADRGDAVRPVEFQDLSWYTRAGQIGRWDPDTWEDPLHPDNEFRRGDFFDLKDLDLSRGDVLSAVCRVYQYWMAVSDCDGFRIDTVKHVPWEASRNFSGAIHEFAESIGKENFLLLGEVTGGAKMARDYLEIFGRNIDAVLDIGAPARRLTDLAKGLVPPGGFFGQFRGHDALGSHRETGRYHVSILDDHDMVGRDKRRFAAGNTIPSAPLQVAHAVGIQLTTLGIPCIYYGTEQAFDGSPSRHDFGIEPHLSFEDRYIRESMFGGTFGAFETEGCHFFDPDHPTYAAIAAIARVRNADDAVGRTLRRGRQYERETSLFDRPFSLPGPGELVAWSRILHDREVLVALNPHGTEDRGAFVTVDASFHRAGESLTRVYGDGPAAEVREERGRLAARIDLPPAAMAIFA